MTDLILADAAEGAAPSVATVPAVPPLTESTIWDAHGELHPLHASACAQPTADVAAILLSRNAPQRADALVRDLHRLAEGTSCQLFVIDLGSDEGLASPHACLTGRHLAGRGPCYGYNVGLRLARARGTFRYVWLLTTDLHLDARPGALRSMLQELDRHPRVAVLVPGSSTALRPVSGGSLAGMVVRAEAIDEEGFLNPGYPQDLGALDEFAFRLYRRNWSVASSALLPVTPNQDPLLLAETEPLFLPADERRQLKLAARHFRERYGHRWDEEFAAALPPGVSTAEIGERRRRWEAVLDPRERTRPGAGVVVTTRAGATGSSPGADPDLVRRIESLHPWYYQVEMRGVRVIPGLGSRQSPQELRGRVAYRSRLLVDEFTRRYDVQGKRVLDIASNCGYWSARYAERGARSLVAVEGRAAYVEQGNLYWSENRFLQPGRFEFLQGDVTATPTWEALAARGPYDLALCLGILYHIPDYRQLLRRLAAVTGEAILVDTRVDADPAGNAGAEALVEEPGGWFFDAIVETRRNRVPVLPRLVETLEELGFAVERLATEARTPAGLKGKDDYNEGRRVALLACRR